MGTRMVDLLEMGFNVVYSFVDVGICKMGRWMMDSLEVHNLILEEKVFTNVCYWTWLLFVIRSNPNLTYQEQ